MIILVIIFLSIFFNNIWLINNESFILSVLLILFFMLIYIFFSFSINLFFFFNVSNILNLLKYSNNVNLYLDKIIYYNIIVKNYFIKSLLKNKNKQIDLLSSINSKINNFLFFSILSFFLNLKKNLSKLIKNKSLLVVNKNLWNAI